MCPNAPDPEVVGYCELCDTDIFEDEEVYMYEDSYYHIDCFEENALEFLKKNHGAYITTID